MTCSISALLFTISRLVSTRPIVGTLSLFHFREAIATPSYIRSSIWYMGTSSSSFRGTCSSRRSRLSGGLTHFVDDKKGERDLMELSLELSRVFCFCLNSYLCTFYLWTCSIWCTCSFILQYVFCGMQLVLRLAWISVWTNIFYDISIVFEKLCISFFLLIYLIHIFCVCGMWYVCIFFMYPLWTNHLPLVLEVEVIGWLEETVCAYTVVILYFWYA